MNKIVNIKQSTIDKMVKQLKKENSVEYFTKIFTEEGSIYPGK